MSDELEGALVAGAVYCAVLHGLKWAWTLKHISSCSILFYAIALLKLYCFVDLTLKIENHKF